MIFLICKNKGSTVATSLSEGEQLQKHIGILHVHQKTFKMHKRPLQTVRQFYFIDIQLNDYIDEKALKTLSNTKLEQKLDKILTDTVKNNLYFFFRKKNKTFFLYKIDY
jgi:double-strand break repair protein MRE11